MIHGLSLAHAKGSCSLGLSVVYTFDTASDNRTHISTGIKCKGNCCREKSLKLDKSKESKLGKSDKSEYYIVDKEYLNQHRRTSYELHVAVCDELNRVELRDKVVSLFLFNVIGLYLLKISERSHIGQKHKCKSESQEETEENCAKRQQDSNYKALLEHVAIGEYLFNITPTDGHKKYSCLSKKTQKSPGPYPGEIITHFRVNVSLKLPDRLHQAGPRKHSQNQMQAPEL